MIKKTIVYFWSLRREFAKYFIVGFSGLFLDMGSLILFTEVFGIIPVVSVILNQVFLLTYNFSLNKYWSFRNKAMPHKQLVRYLSLAVFNYLFSVGTMYVFNHILNWDYRIPRFWAATMVCAIPLLIFLLGLRSFIMVIDIVGGVFISLTMLTFILVYWRAKRLGDIEPGKYHLDHIYLLAAILFLVFAIGAVNSVVKLF